MKGGPLHTDLLDRLAAKFVVDPETGCYIWTAYRDRDGYGRIQVNGSGRPSHREMYKLTVGEIPEGLTVDHLCKNRACQNVDHMELVTNVENVMRGNSLAAQNARKTHCKRGHLLSGDNLFMDGTERQCRACKSAREKTGRLRRGR